MTEASERYKGHDATEQVIDAIRDHETKASGWAYSRIAHRMNVLYDQLNGIFFAGKLPKAVISIGVDLIVRYGYYRIGRDEIGAKHRIHLNSRHFGRSESDVAVTLLHEMIHLYQHLYGHIGHRQRYHNSQFVGMAASVGIHAQVGNGATLAVSSDLRRKLEALGFSPHHPMVEGESNEPIRKPLRKVLYRCECGQEVWADRNIEVEAVCSRCFKLFEQIGGKSEVLKIVAAENPPPLAA
ncbi:SprT-like domain-containing protein [Pontiellaceae bacterium B12227]|nr:SprT-like domain-containing protein [Pontiellaceae bacterium B12227]